MAEKNDGGDKTEKPTRKRLLDARKKGDIAKSKDVGPALSMVLWFLMLLFATGFAGSKIVALMNDSLTVATGAGFAHQSFAITAPTLGWAAFSVLLVVTLTVLGPAVVVGFAAEFVQVGALVTTEKIKPTLSHLNPAEGFKKMFSFDNLVELLKTVVKAALILAIGTIILWRSIGDFASLIQAAAWSPVESNGGAVAGAILALTRSLSIQLFAWTCGIFLLVAAADRAWSQHRHTKKLMMSRRDIKQEHKDNEGDPMVRGMRRQMHEEWANQNAIGAAGGANVLLVNPTHLTIALDYDPEEFPVPTIAAKGEGPLAAAMRAEAERAGVPIVRNVGLTRSIWAQADTGSPIPREHFDVIAEIILWARRAREGLEPTMREDQSWSMTE